MIDLDHNATTSLDPRVRAVMVGVMEDSTLQGNPSSAHQRGQHARALVERARERVHVALEAEDADVVFTSSGTEADNLAIIGVARALRAAGHPADLLTSPLEHPAVRRACEALRRDGHAVFFVPVDARGRIEPAAVGRCLEQHPSVGLVSLMAANHELGNLYDLPELALAAKSVAPRVLVHSDAVQALGKVPVSMRRWGVDLLSVSGHKVHGPKGSGALLVRGAVPMHALIHGGPQERGLRAGTLPVPAIAGLAEAVALAAAEVRDRSDHCVALRQRVLDGVVRISGATVNGDTRRHVGNTVNVAFAGCEGQLVAMALDVEGVCVSTGAACASGTLEPSPVLMALGQTPGEAGAAIRISVGSNTSEQDVARLLQLLPDVVGRIRERSPSRGTGS